MVFIASTRSPMYIEDSQENVSEGLEEEELHGRNLPYAAG
jgi:hypothetical protein